jgi:uncharacterized protein (TIGR03435 family)
MMKALLATAHVTLLSMGLTDAAAMRPQTQDHPGFEVSTIKPADPSSPVMNGTSFSHNRFTATGPVRFLIKIAYGIQDFQISGGPKWLNTDMFDIDAKSEHPASTHQLLLMLQALLADRFKLILHTEKKDLPAYALVSAHEPMKLREVKDGTETMSMGRGQLSGKMSIPVFANHLAPIVGRTVLDRTGLTGLFAIKLDWMPDEALPGNESPGPSIFTAVQEQLGLKLESIKGPVEVLVIDHAEKPTEN